jgi:hypothetical protein
VEYHGSVGLSPHSAWANPSGRRILEGTCTLKTNDNKSPHPGAGWWRRGYTAWAQWRGGGRARPVADSAQPPADQGELAPPRASALECIQEHLRGHGLGQQVHVRPEPAGEGFVLEDADGLVHARDYPAAVAVIQQIWLSQRSGAAFTARREQAGC